MVLGSFVSGLTLGLFFAMPVGPVAVYCVRRALARGVLLGGLAGVGAAVADTLFAAIAVSTTHTLVDRLVDHAALLRLPGAVLLAGFGFFLLGRPGRDGPRAGTRDGPVGAAVTTFLFAMINPVTIVAFAASIVLMRAVLPGPPSSLPLLAGVFAGSAVWWFAVSGLAVLVGLRRAHLVVVDRVAGGLLVLAGGVGLISVL